MKTIQTKTHTGADGTLSLRLPADMADADVNVVVSVESLSAATPLMSSTEWTGFIAQTAGCIADDTFTRPEQGEFERRDDMA